MRGSHRIKKGEYLYVLVRVLCVAYTFMKRYAGEKPTPLGDVPLSQSFSKKETSRSLMCKGLSAMFR